MSCDAYDEAVRGSKLAGLEIGTPAPPLPDAFDEVGATIVAPRIRLSVIERDDVTGGDADRPTVMVVGRMDGSADDARKEVEATLGAQGFTRADLVSGRENGKLADFTLGYEGHGITGSIGFRGCKGGDRVVVHQVIRPDRVGEYRRPDLAARCTKLFEQAVALIERPVGGATAPEGTADFQPLAVTVTPAGTLRAAMRATSGMRPALSMSLELQRAFEGAGWRRVGGCDPRQGFCLPAFPDGGGDGPTVLEFTTPGYRAVVRVTDAADGRGPVTVEGHVEEA